MALVSYSNSSSIDESCLNDFSNPAPDAISSLPESINDDSNSDDEKVDATLPIEEWVTQLASVHAQPSM